MQSRAAKNLMSKKVGKVMREFKKGKLNIGKSKKKVQKRSQAIAIGLSMGRKLVKKSKKK